MAVKYNPIKYRFTRREVAMVAIMIKIIRENGLDKNNEITTVVAKAFNREAFNVLEEATGGKNSQ